MFTACPPTHTPSHRASRPHCGGYSHPGGEDKQCGKGGEDNHHSNPLLTLHTPLTPHTLYTHSTHTLHTLPSQAAMESGFEDHIPCHTVTMACISSNAAIATGANDNFHLSLPRASSHPFPSYPPPHNIHTGVCQIASGQSDVVIAGGVDFMSDVPIRLSRGLRKTLLSLNKVSVYHQDTISTSLSILSIWDPSFLRPKLWGLVLASFWEV